MTELTDEPEPVVDARHLLALRASPAFADLDADVIAALALVFTDRFLPRGAWLARAGRPMAAASFVLEGRVRIGGPRPRVVEHGPIGVLEVLAGDGRRLDARAETDVHVLWAPSGAVLDLLEEHFGFLGGTLQALARASLAEVMRRPADAWPPPRPAVLPIRGDAPLRLAERIMHLRSVLFFAGSRVEALAELARVSKEVRISAGGRLWRKGDASEAAWLLVAGEVECRGAFGTMRLQPGNSLGGVEAMARQPHWYDATAVTPVRALCTARDALLDVIEDQTDVGVDLVRHVANRLLALRDGIAT